MVLVHPGSLRQNTAVVVVVEVVVVVVWLRYVKK